MRAIGYRELSPCRDFSAEPRTERSDFLRDEIVMKIHTAQKDHKCFLCGKKIPKGHKYWRKYQESDGGLIDEKEHTNCELYAAHAVQLDNTESA